MQVFFPYYGNDYWIREEILGFIFQITRSTCFQIQVFSTEKRSFRYPQGQNLPWPQSFLPSLAICSLSLKNSLNIQVCHFRHSLLPEPLVLGLRGTFHNERALGMAMPGITSSQVQLLQQQLLYRPKRSATAKFVASLWKYRARETGFLIATLNHTETIPNT